MAATTTRPVATVRVLLIDDDKDDCRLVGDLLKEAKRATFLPTCAHTKQDALEQLRKAPYDVILMDYKLGGNGDALNGLDLLEEIRATYRMPAILITNHGDRQLQAEALERGVAEYLEKGVFTADLLERTCLYAIGLREQEKAADGGPGVGILIEQLVGLTRESVAAQVSTEAKLTESLAAQDRTVAAIHELRTDLVKNQTECQEICSAEHVVIQKEIKGLSKFRWALDWGVEHPTAAVLIFLGLLVAVVLAVLLLQVLDVDKIQQLKELKEGVKTSALVVWWIPFLG